MSREFRCEHCGIAIPIKLSMGTHHRNHCPNCLYSKHVDLETGDRKNSCKALMEPIGLTFKKVAPDKFGKEKVGELMIIHRCTIDNEFSINRLAADDNPEVILDLFEESKSLNEEIKNKLKLEEIDLIDQSDEEELKIQLFGKGDERK